MCMAWFLAKRGLILCKAVFYWNGLCEIIKNIMIILYIKQKINAILNCYLADFMIYLLTKQIVS